MIKLIKKVLCYVCKEEIDRINATDKKRYMCFTCKSKIQKRKSYEYYKKHHLYTSKDL